MNDDPPISFTLPSVSAKESHSGIRQRASVLRQWRHAAGAGPAGVTFFVLLALFPGIAGLISLYTGDSVQNSATPSRPRAYRFKCSICHVNRLTDWRHGCSIEDRRHCLTQPTAPEMQNRIAAREGHSGLRRYLDVQERLRLPI